VAHTWAFRAAGTERRVAIRATSNLAGDNIEIKNIMLHEVAPGCVAADAKGPDGWTKTNDMDLHREHDGSNTKDGSFYSLKITPSAINDTAMWPNAGIRDTPLNVAKFAGRTVTVGAWVKTSTADHVRVGMLVVGAAQYLSSFHTGGGGWEWLEISQDVSSAATGFQFVIHCAKSSGDAYISQPMLVFGSSIGEGNYVQSPEIVWMETPGGLTGYTGAGAQTTTETTLNIEALSNGKIPKGAKALNISLEGSCASPEAILYLLAVSAGNTTMRLWAQVSTVVVANAGWVPIDATGNIYMDATATFAEIQIVFTGVQL
jgi:hypothetical protein